MEVGVHDVVRFVSLPSKTALGPSFLETFTCEGAYYHHLFTLSARSYTIPRNLCDAFSTPVAINLIRFRDFGERLIGEDARGPSSKGLLVYPPLVLAATVCGYDRTRYVARTVQQLLLASTTRRRDGSRRNKREKA